MMSDKRTCRRSSGNGLQHRGFHLQIPFGIEEIPDSVDHPGTFHKDFLDLRIHDQVEITLAVTLFGIGKGIEHLAFLLFHNRQRPQRFRQHGQFFGVYGNLTCLCAEHKSLHSDNVTDIHQFLENRIVSGRCFICRNIVPADIHLDPAGSIL